jgi:hypothetical protein
MNQGEYDYSPGSAGWGARVMVFPGTQMDSDFTRGTVEWKAPSPQYSVLMLDVSTSAPAKAEVDTADAAPSDKVFKDAAALVGSTLDAAQKRFGDEFRIESGDDDEDAAEATGEKQGYARLSTPWSSEPWEATFQVDKKTKHIDQVTFHGQLADEHRRDMFGALRRDFGAPKPEVDDNGTIGILYTAPRVTVYAPAGVEDVTLTITAR